MQFLVRSTAIFVLLISLWTSFSAAAAPDVKFFSPSGVQVGQTVAVTVSPSLDAKAQIWCSRDGLKVERSDDPKKANIITITVPANAVPGLCWFRFYNEEGSTSLKPFIIGTLPEQAETEPNNKLTEAKPLASSQLLINGSFAAAGDVDVYAVALKKGQTLVASMEANRTLGSLSDGILQIVSPAGFVLEQNDDDHGNDPQIVFTATADGVYYVRTFGFPVKPNSSIKFAGGAGYIYRLTITTGPFVDHTWPMSVTRGQSAKVKLIGWNIPAELNEFPVNAIGIESNFSIHHPKLATVSTIRVHPHPVAVENEPNDLDHAQPVPFPVTVTGRIDQPGDLDVYSVKLTKGQKVRFRVESRKLGQPMDPVLALFDATGKLIKETETRTRGVFDETYPFTANVDGEFRIRVSDLFDKGGRRFAYRLTIDEQKPDYQLGLKADLFQLTPGTPLPDKPFEIPVTIARQFGFNSEIEITVTGLPAGVTCAAVKSLPKGATAKAIKLVLNGKDAKPFNGPIRIVGKSLGDNPVEQSATATITGLTAKTSNIWLTVLKPKPEETKKSDAKKK